ncbi:hypothetical protein TSMEX_001374 [Taenia solium]|eukprot:TsM_000581900 transcript=TsM_000581900 gene=TsM_000581900
MLAGITNKSIQLSDVDELFISPSKRRKGNMPYKCKSEFPIDNIVDAIEPINLTHKIGDETQQLKGGSDIRLPSAISNFQLSLAAHLQNVDFNANVNISPEAINFQKSVLRYLAELNEKTQIRPSELKDPWNLHFNDKSLQSNPHAFARTTPSDCKGPGSTLLANDIENVAAIDLRVRPPKSTSDGCSVNYGRASLPHESRKQVTSPDCPDGGRISGFLSHAFNRQPPSLSPYPNDLPPSFPSRHLFSRFPVRSPPRCLSSRRIKTASLKNKKPRSLGGYSPTSITSGRDSQCSGPLLSKKPSFRGTSEEENEVCPHFKPVEQNILSGDFVFHGIMECLLTHKLVAFVSNQKNRFGNSNEVSTVYLPNDEERFY